MADLEDTKLRSLAPVQSTSETPPTWVQCELCERAASNSLPRLVAAFANPERKVSSGRGSLVLLCRDCLELVRGNIDESEWRRRIGR